MTYKHLSLNPSIDKCIDTLHTWIHPFIHRYITTYIYPSHNSPDVATISWMSPFILTSFSSNLFFILQPKWFLQNVKMVISSSCENHSCDSLLIKFKSFYDFFFACLSKGIICCSISLFLSPPAPGGPRHYLSAQGWLVACAMSVLAVLDHLACLQQPGSSCPPFRTPLCTRSPPLGSSTLTLDHGSILYLLSSYLLNQYLFIFPCPLVRL